MSRLLKKFKEAEKEIADLGQRQGGLRKRMEQAAAMPKAQKADAEQKRRQLERLTAEQKQLQEKTEAMARRLERLTAEQAAKSAGQAAEKMGQAAQCCSSGQCGGACDQAQQAQKHLEESRNQLAQQKRQAESQLGTEQMARLEDSLKGLSRRQRAAMEETQRLDGLGKASSGRSKAQEASLTELAREQKLLRDETTALAEKMRGAPVFHLALSGVADPMSVAAGRLDRRETGEPTQNAQSLALAHLDLTLESLKPEAAPGKPGQGKPGEKSDGAGRRGRTTAGRRRGRAGPGRVETAEAHATGRTPANPDARRSRPPRCAVGRPVAPRVRPAQRGAGPPGRPSHGPGPASGRVRQRRLTIGGFTLNVRHSAVWYLAFALMLFTGLAVSAQKESGDPKSKDAELLKSLSDSGDELDRELFGPQEKGAKPGEPARKTAAGKDDARQPSSESAAGGGELDNPLVGIARQMREAQQRIAQNDSGEKTQVLQDRILIQLQELLQKKCQQCAGAQCDPKAAAQQKASPDQKQDAQRQAKPGETKRSLANIRTPKGMKPVQKTSERPTSNKPAKPNLEEWKAMVGQGPWGQLPDRQREQMLQLGKFEEFLPKYDWMIEEYFKRLSEEQK